MRKIISECIENPKRFTEAIKKQKIYNFAAEAGKKKIHDKKDGKLVETCLVRDLFGSVLFLSLERKVDM